MRSVFFACAKNAPTAKADLLAALATCSVGELKHLAHDWEVWARDDQLPPPCVAGASWRTWLVLGGRGAGKTRAGAEWVRALALGRPPFAARPARRIALVGETIHDVRSVMIEGVSGLLAVHTAAERPAFVASKGQLEWPNGTVGQIYSAAAPDSLRGPQFDAAWCDEIAKWRNADEVWDMLQFALRLGDMPRVVATTTPRPVAILSRLLGLGSTVVSRARTRDNAENLAPAFVDEMRRRYGGTQLGRQELDGELIEALAGALWRADWIGAQRVMAAPEMQRIVVAVDPPVTAKATSDACGIVVAGIGVDGRGYVLADRSVQGRTPTTWARAAVAAYHDFKADRLVAEVNQGGDLVETVIRQVDGGVAFSQVRATRGKWIRAEPVAALYAQGRVVHVGVFGELEAEMVAFGTPGRAAARSPDRVDALVWAITELMLAHHGQPSARLL